MSSSESGEVTVLLKAWGGGDRQALDRLTPRVYDELRRMSRKYMRNEREGHTLQATALVNDVYLRLVDATAIDWKDRAHFFAVCAQMMRRILVDAARARGSRKRGGGVVKVDVEDACVGAPGRDASTIALDDALTALAKFDPRKAQVIELRYFGGLSVEETAEVLKISPQSVMRDWKLAKAWLMRELSAANS
jgi:RNA polymerase sigma-70 factor, ECF subfamily